MPQRERIDPSRTDASDRKLAAEVKEWAMRPRGYLKSEADEALLKPWRTKGDINLPYEKPPTKPAETKPVAKRSLRSRDLSKR